MGMLAQPQFAHVFTQPVAKLLFPLVIHTGDDAQAGGVSQVIKSFIESDAFVPRLLINCPLVIPIRVEKAGAVRQPFSLEAVRVGLYALVGELIQQPTLRLGHVKLVVSDQKLAERSEERRVGTEGARVGRKGWLA